MEDNWMFKASDPTCPNDWLASLHILYTYAPVRTYTRMHTLHTHARARQNQKTLTCWYLSECQDRFAQFNDLL